MIQGPIYLISIIIETFNYNMCIIKIYTKKITLQITFDGSFKALIFKIVIQSSIIFKQQV